MGSYGLTKEGLLHIDNLIKITSSLYSLHNNHYRIKCEGERRQYEYKLNMECLKMTTQMESNEYNNKFRNSSKIRSVIDYLVETYEIPNFFSFLDNILPKNNKQMIVKRIISMLYDYDHLSKEEYNKSIGLKSQSISIGNDFNKVIVKNANDCKTYEEHLDLVEMHWWLEKTAIQIFLINLEELLNDNVGETVKDRLNTSKNNLLFLNSWFEDEYMIYEYNNAMIKPKINNPTLFFNRYLDVYDAEKNNYGYYYCNSIIDKIVNLTCSSEYLDIKDLPDLLLMQVYLKTCLSFVDNATMISTLRNKASKKVDDYIDGCEGINKEEILERTSSFLQLFDGVCKQYVKQ